MRSSLINSEVKEMSDSRMSLVKFGALYARLMSTLGEEATEKVFGQIADVMGGERLTIPTIETLEREARDARLRVEYDQGLTRLELAGRFAIDPSTVNRILNRPPLFSGESEE